MSYEKKREGFTFYWSFYEAVVSLNDRDKSEVWKAIIEYALLGKEPTFKKEYLSGYFFLIKPNINSSIKKYDQRRKAIDSRHDRCSNEGGTENVRIGYELITESTNKNTNTEYQFQLSNSITNSISNTDTSELYSCYPTDLKNALMDFEEMRNRIKKPLTNAARKDILKRLHEYSDGDVAAMIEIVNKSVVNCWKDVFPLNGDTGKKGGKIDILDL